MFLKTQTQKKKKNRAIPHGWTEKGSNIIILFACAYLDWLVNSNKHFVYTRKGNGK